MRDIEGFEAAVKKLGKQWPEIEKHFNEENERYKQLFSQDHDRVGRILKCHLLVEHYLDKFIAHEKKIDNLQSVRLSFYQKAQLIPTEGVSASVVRPGILELNTIRNKFSHNLYATIETRDIQAMRQLLEVARLNIIWENPVRQIEAFTTVTCTWLLITPPELEEVFKQAFEKVIVRSEEY
ncbi:hypothetical protein [Marispirochaeta sp.]|uniref:hypothetical protein n=1 Tax=Marispirochaeta sp. TaxID=2038653 RepID=UPI0029C63E2A|nr:hypothetical protein [Marispirochaeta sp.]